MTIENGYITLAEFKASSIADSDTDVADDAVIEDIITATSRFIDSETNRIFYENEDTFEFDLPDSRELRLRKDLVSIDALTNGDGVAIASSDYLLIPANVSPKYAVRLKQSSSVGWVGDSDGNTEQVIEIEGSWGYLINDDTPFDIKQACMDISNQAYNRREGTNNTGAVTITGAGVVISPQDVPQQARRTINHYKRRL